MTATVVWRDVRSIPTAWVCGRRVWVQVSGNQMVVSPAGGRYGDGALSGFSFLWVHRRCVVIGWSMWLLGSDGTARFGTSGATVAVGSRNVRALIRRLFTDCISRPPQYGT